jgi:hypothetical protein
MKALQAFENDKLKKDVAVKMAKENLQPNDPQFTQVMKGIEFCFDAANSRHKRFLDIKNGPEMVVGQANCNPISGFMMDCMERYMLRVRKPAPANYIWSWSNLPQYFRSVQKPNGSAVWPVKSSNNSTMRVHWNRYKMYLFRFSEK